MLNTYGVIRFARVSVKNSPVYIKTTRKENSVFRVEEDHNACEGIEDVYTR